MLVEYQQFQKNCILFAAKTPNLLRVQFLCCSLSELFDSSNQKKIDFSIEKKKVSQDAIEFELAFGSDFKSSAKRSKAIIHAEKWYKPSGKIEELRSGHSIGTVQPATLSNHRGKQLRFTARYGRSLNTNCLVLFESI